MFEELYETEAASKTLAGTAVATKSAGEIDLDKVDLTKIALAHFDASRAAVKIATDTLTDVVHDLSTPGKLADAKSLRQRLINAPLAEARKVEKGLAAKLNGARKAVGSALVTIEGEFEAVEKFITPQIEARDTAVAIEKAEREAKEAERVAIHRAGITQIAGYVTQLQGRTSAQIQSAMNTIDAIMIDPAQWEEFAAGAEIQKAETLEALQSLFDRTKAAEVEAAAREAQRIENERAAAALAEQARILAEKEAELNAKLAKIAAAEKAEADRIEAAAQAARDAEAKAARDAQALADAAARQATEDESNTKAQEVAAAEALQRAADATPVDVITDAYGPQDLSDDALTAIPSIADQVPAVSPPAAAVAAETASLILSAVSPGLLHPAPGPVTFAEPEPAASTLLVALLAHIDEAFTGRFSAHPKPTREWWGALRRLSDEAREFVVG
jgi:hypothetical protein